MQGQLAFILLIICFASSSAARLVQDDAARLTSFDSFDYGVVDNPQSYDDLKDDFPFDNSWESRATKNRFDANNAFDDESRATANTFGADDNVRTAPFFSREDNQQDAAAGNGNTFDVTKYGAAGNGQTDDSKAFLDAWRAVCGARTQGIATLVVPQGKTFLLKSVEFEGPCNSKYVNFKIQGNIIAPKNIGDWTDKDRWIQFMHIDGLILNGGGVINGNGADWWKACGQNNCPRPSTLLINEGTRLQLSGLTFLDSPMKNIRITGINGGIISGLKITAPADSPNTDGINLSQSNKITIQNSDIGTGDDCISLLTGTSFIKINNVVCGPGHGISIGSLGRDGQRDTVENIEVRNITIKGADNGLRIKTWEGGAGYAKNIIYEGVVLSNSKNPIIIDQHYSHNPGMRPTGQAVQVSNVTFRNVHGTSATQAAITLDCAAIGCSGIVMEDISLTTTVPNKRAVAVCKNASGKSSQATPKVPCLN